MKNETLEKYKIMKENKKNKRFGFRTIADVKKANKENGFFWFSKGAMKFFDTKIETSLLKGGYFVTSEDIDCHNFRKYKIRRVKNDKGNIETIGDSFNRLEKAKEIIRDMLQKEKCF